MGRVHVTFPIVILHCGLASKMLPLGETGAGHNEV